MKSLCSKSKSLNLKQIQALTHNSIYYYEVLELLYAVWFETKPTKLIS